MSAMNAVSTVASSGRLTRYTTTAIAFHWMFVALLAVMFPLGFIMHNMPLSPDKLEAYAWHKSLGVTVLSLAILRLAWRLFHRPPPLPTTMPQWQKTVSRLVHGFLYGALFAMPISGWLMSSAAGFTVAPYKLFELPNLVGKDKALQEVLTEVHELFAFLLLGLIILHFGAAIYHQFVRRDDLLMRMLPSRARTEPTP